MDDAVDDDVVAAVVAAVAPGATPVRAWALAGGISARMTAVEIRPTDGGTRRFVVRVPLPDISRTVAIEDEARLLTRLRSLGLPVPAVLHVDSTRALLPQSWVALDYVDGAPDVAPADPVAVASELAAVLHRIHQVDTDWPETAALLRRADNVTSFLAKPRRTLDESTREPEIRAALLAHWPPAQANADALLHGDFWPGNVLRHKGQVVAVIDWEDAVIGDPLADVAVTRLDLLWVYGEAAMRAFTDAYVLLADIDTAALPVWELVAALRPCGWMSVWAGDWPALGRPDITTTSMRATHSEFVAAALAAIRN